MDFRITAWEEELLLTIVAHLDAGSAPTVDELSGRLERDAEPEVASLRSKGWILVRQVDGRETVIALSPMAVMGVRNLRYGGRG
ncbi:hypothetical protein ACR820_05880 [Streptomyces netropsis]